MPCCVRVTWWSDGNSRWTDVAGNPPTRPFTAPLGFTGGRTVNDQLTNLVSTEHELPNNGKSFKKLLLRTKRKTRRDARGNTRV